MISFLISLIVLFAGYLFYGKFTEHIFSPDNRLTPADEINDGVDCIPMKPWKAFLIQLLNIAGTGPIFPFMFITVACGAISGFHATQSPMIEKCITTEKVGRKVFYGAMITEAVIALVWAAAGIAFYGTTQMLNETITELGQSSTVYDISKTLLGNVGGALAVIGVVICPITSGDTAFRSVRLILAEWTGLSQKEIRNRLILAVLFSRRRCCSDTA